MSAELAPPVGVGLVTGQSAQAAPCTGPEPARPAFSSPPGRKLRRVAVALGGTDLGQSGIGTYVHEMLPALVSALSPDGVEVAAFGHRDELAAYAAALAGASCCVVPLLPRRPGPNALWHLAQAGWFARRRLGADVLLLPAGNRRITAWSPVPTVAVVHDLAQLRVERKYDRVRMAYFHRLLLPAFRRSTRLVAVSHATRNDLVQFLGVSAERVQVVYNGVNSRTFRTLDPADPTVRSVRARAGLSDMPYLLYPARLEHPGKNHVRLIRAFAAAGLPATHRLVLTGRDWGAGGLIRETVRKLGLESRVVPLGFVDSESLAALMAGADGVLLLGLHEGFGLPPLEALSAGRPVCVSNTGALPEVVGSLGVQCDPLDVGSIASALRCVVDDFGVRDRCRREGPAWAERFSWRRTADGLIAACREAFAKGLQKSTAPTPQRGEGRTGPASPSW